MTVTLRRLSFPSHPTGERWTWRRRSVAVAADVQCSTRVQFVGRSGSHKDIGKVSVHTAFREVRVRCSGNLLESETGASECVEAELGLASGMTACVPTGGRAKGVGVGWG
jgi:hypothetical protein